jgi:predicted RNase H-like HicB family nuclease
MIVRRAAAAGLVGLTAVALSELLAVLRGRRPVVLPAVVAEEERYGHYSMQLVWDPDDRIYVVSVPELPGCMTHGATAEEAARNGREAIASWLGAAREWRDPIPAPREERHALALDEAPNLPAAAEARLPAMRETVSA